VLVEPDAGFIHIGGARSIASSPTGSRKRWPSPKSMSELHADLSFAQQQNQELAKEAQQLRERLETVSQELQTALKRSYTSSDTIERPLRSMSWKILRLSRRRTKCSQVFCSANYQAHP
jgi:hypothetical protein